MSQFVFQSLTDAVIGFVESNGRFFIMDMWTTGYLQPILESSQDLSRQEGKFSISKVHINICRVTLHTGPE